jgi:UPF0755 protein
VSRGSWAFLVILVVVAGGVLFGVRWANDQLQAEAGPDAGQPVAFQVELGTSLPQLASDLEDDGVIRNATAFRVVARADGFYESLRAGDYELETGMATDQVITVLRAGPQGAEEVEFTVEEGLTVDQTLTRLVEQFPQYTADDFRAELTARLDAGGPGENVLSVPGVLPEVSEFGAEVRDPWEGLLFPQTYRVVAEASPRAILQRMLDQLTNELDRITPEQRDGIEARGLELYEALVAASLIERETQVDDERAIVSSVIENRLEIGQALQIDATVLYAIDEQKDRVLIADTEVDSPYNTYSVQGLPPTPISGFGRASLEAALSPDDTPFFYYVLTPECDGRHVFAETLAGHNSNVAAFRAADNCL